MSIDLMWAGAGAPLLAYSYIRCQRQKTLSVLQKNSRKCGTEGVLPVGCGQNNINCLTKNTKKSILRNKKTQENKRMHR
ncbi:MAG: hypothetical protein MR585_02625, partial [Selenomonas bovis]|nr:hypothetical protein [Selenomonas bovis]